MTEMIETLDPEETLDPIGSETTQDPEPESEPEPEPACTLIEAIVISHLASVLNTDDVYAERPTDPPAKYYVIEKTAAGRKNFVSTATVAVQSISSGSLLEAAQMSKDAERAMENLITVANVSAVRLNSAYNFTDPETREYRYQAIFDLYYMEGD